MPYLAMIHRLATSDVHPPLYFSILWLSGRLIGFGDFAVRVPSIIFGVLLIPLVYLLGKEAYDRKTGAVAAVIVSVAPYVLWYSQEARMYELLMVFGVICLWAQLRILHHGGWYPWVLYTLASIAMVCTQYFGIWQLLTQQLIFIGVIVFRWRRHQKPGALLRPWLCSAAVVLTALIPLGLMMKGQFANAQNTGQAFRGAAGASLSVYSVITNFGYAVVGFHSTPVMSDLVSLWPFGMLAALVVLGRRCKPVSYLLVVLVVVPVAAMFVLGDLKQSLADVRYQSTIVPVLLLLIARAVTSLATSKRALGVVMVRDRGGDRPLLCSISSSPVRIPAGTTSERPSTGWTPKSRPGDVILYDPVADELNTVVSYYSPRAQIPPAVLGADCRGRSHHLHRGQCDLDGRHRTARFCNSALGHLNFHRKHPPEHWVFPNVQVWVYR